MNNKENILSVVASLKACSCRQALDKLRGIELSAKILKESGELVWREQVENATALLFEMIGNDLRYTLPGEIADRMTTATESRRAMAAARAAVEVVISSWKKTGVEIQENKKQKETK